MRKTWLITGTSAGFGRLLTERLLARGDRVAATLRRPGALADLQARFGEQLHVVRLDVTDTASMPGAVADAFATLGRIDVVVNNAAYGLFGAAEELSDAQITQQIATNLVGSIQLIRTVLPHLRQQGGGRIVQVSSEGGQMAYPGFSLYHATKWGIEGFVESVAQEVAPFGIDCMLVEPGPTGTRFKESLDLAPPLAAYVGTPAGNVRQAIVGDGFPIPGDAGRTVDAMIEAMDADAPPFRLPLGSLAFTHIEAALRQRLHAMAPLEAIARSADATP